MVDYSRGEPNSDRFLAGTFPPVCVIDGDHTSVCPPSLPCRAEKCLDKNCKHRSASLIRCFCRFSPWRAPARSRRRTDKIPRKFSAERCLQFLTRHFFVRQGRSGEHTVVWSPLITQAGGKEPVKNRSGLGSPQLYHTFPCLSRKNVVE